MAELCSEAGEEPGYVDSDRLAEADVPDPGAVARDLMGRAARGEDGDGMVILAGRSSVMTCEHACQDRCRIVIPWSDSPAIGTPVRVGIAGQPIIQGLAWAAGHVVDAYPDELERGTVVEIRLRRRGGLVPSVYDRVVHHREREPALPRKALAHD